MLPLDIINGPLMAGMEEVGRLFNNNELIVAEVLQSRRSHESFRCIFGAIYGEDGNGRKGKIMLATVKGDVHDIGKNLVRLFSNNGYENH